MLSRPMPRQLSKSRLLSFRQCPRKLWLEVHRPELDAHDPERQAHFDTGQRVGAIARTLYSSSGVGRAIKVGVGTGVSAEAKIQPQLPFPGEAGIQVLFEPRFTRDDVVIRADVLEQSATATRLIEVKASASVKAHYIPDCAIQAWVLQGAGVELAQIALAHVDTQFIYAGDGNYRGLLTEADVTAQVAALAQQVPTWARDAQVVLAGDEPATPVGQHCFSPHECPFQAHCWPKVEHPLTALPKLGERLDHYVASGYRDLRDVPEEELRGAEAVRVWHATRAGRVEMNAALREALSVFGYPRFYLDFETIQPTVPIWPGTRPCQAIAYQWSIHAEPEPGRLEHLEHLDTSGELPVVGVARSLVDALGMRGPIFMYTPFERTVIERLAALVPALAEALHALIPRLVDLHPIVKRNYYHPAMQGSWSIKAVLPTVVPEMRYEHLGEVREGQGAERAFLEAIDPATSRARRERLRRALLEYCSFDTEAMVRLVRAFTNS